MNFQKSEIVRLAEYAKEASDAYIAICSLLDFQKSDWLRQDTDKSYRIERLPFPVSLLHDALYLLPQSKKDFASDSVLSSLEKSLEIAEKSNMLIIEKDESQGQLVRTKLQATWEILPADPSYLLIGAEGYYLRNCFHVEQHNLQINLVKGDIVAYFAEIKNGEAVKKKISLREFGQKHKELHKALITKK